jgi:hypothetical protein
MPEERTYSPEEIVHDCKLIEAIWEQIRNDLNNKAQLAGDLFHFGRSD